MKKWKSDYYVSHGTKLHYYRTGGSKPPLVLIHGISDDGLCWTPVAEALEGDYDVIMVDLRGHGKSEAPDDGYDYKTMATEVAGLIPALGLGKPVVMGHSLGAMTTLTIAGLFPDIPKAIILEDPPAFWRTEPPSQEELNFRAEMRAAFYETKRKTRAELLEIARAENPGWSETELDPWADAKHRFSIKITKILDARETILVDFQTLLKQITCPALLITADPALGAIVTDENVADLKKYIPHLQRQHISGAGHSIRREGFSDYIKSLNAFLHETR
jgi:pimeloyl-ACP methyl ester carboxylesterase